MKRVLITTGDHDGIGLEITAKALEKVGPQKNVQFLFFSNTLSEKKQYSRIDKKFKRVVLKDLYRALESSPNPKEILEIRSDLNPALSFEQSVLAAQQGRVQALVTAPLSKKTIHSAGLDDCGHTDILRRLLVKKDLLMAFKGKKFSVVLMSDHVPYKRAPQHITRDLVDTAIQTVFDNLSTFKLPKKSRLIGLLGLNPHAGETLGLGNEEENVLMPSIMMAQKKGIPIQGPLIPDVCFQKEHYSKHGVYICMYHDQGLIPFKIYHGHRDGFQITLNLPFVRVSVDHGTAKDIFGKNKADPSSMLEALRFCL